MGRGPRGVADIIGDRPMTPRARSILVDGYGLASRWCLAASQLLRGWAALWADNHERYQQPILTTEKSE